MHVADVPASQRVGAWTEVIYREYYPLDLAASVEEFGRGELAILDLPGVRIGTVDCDPMLVHRRRRHLAISSEDFYFVPIPLGQPLGLEQGDRETLLQPGDLAAINTSNAYAYLQHTPNQLITLRLDGARLRERLPLIDDLVAVPCRNQNALTAVFVDFVRSLATHRDALDAPTASALVPQLLDLLALTLTAPVGAVESSESTVRLAHLRRIYREVDASLGRFDLGVDTLAKALGVSRRYVQRLLAARGETASGLIRTRRLGAARRLLADPARNAHTIASIGHAAGFADPTQFSRAFRHATGFSPKDYRQHMQDVLRSTGDSGP